MGGWRVLRTLVVVAALVVGCGGGGGDDDPAAPADAGGDPIRIGVAYPDLSAVAVLNPEFAIGDPEQQAAAMVEAWRREGLLPGGRDVELVFRTYSVLNDDEKLAACTGFAQDDDVFAVVGGRYFTPGARCLSDRFDIPVISTDSAPAASYSQSAPYFFTLQPDQSAYLRTLAGWADDSGYLDGRTIGLFYETRLDEGIVAFKEELTARGHAIAEELSSTGEGVGSAQDELSVQRFVAADVDLAILAIGGVSWINVMSSADRQGFVPDYLDLDYGEHTTDVAARTNPPTQYDGTRAFTATRIGETAAGMELNEATQRCVERFTAFGGEDPDPGPPESGEWGNILLTCDLMEVLLAGLEAGGADGDRDAFVAAVEAIQGMEAASFGDIGFSADDHSGADQAREITWDADCPCWEATGEFLPLLR